MAITGIGAVTPIGISRDGCGTDCARSARRFVRSRGSTRRCFAATTPREVNDFVPTDFIEAKRAKRLDRFGQFSVVAARAGDRGRAGSTRAEDRERIGSMMGTRARRRRLRRGAVVRLPDAGLRGRDADARARPSSAARRAATSRSSSACMGPNSTNAMSCASGTIAIGEGISSDPRRLRRRDDLRRRRGAAPPLCFGAFAIIRAMSTRNDDPTHASRPFDRDRDGFVMGEGAAVLDARGARARDRARRARSTPRCCGYGTDERRAPHDGAASRRIAGGALDARSRSSDAQRRADEIDVRQRARQLHAAQRLRPRRSRSSSVFGDHAYRMPVSSTKGYYGHALGASGAIEAAICALALRNGWLPPTLNLQTPDAACDLDYIPATGRAGGSRRHPEQLVRLRRDQRRAGDA